MVLGRCPRSARALSRRMKRGDIMLSATHGTLKVHCDDKTLTFQPDGRATMHQSLPLRQRAEQALAAGVQAVRVDLRRCTYMDSTFLGTLLFLYRTMAPKGPGAFALVSPS